MCLNGLGLLRKVIEKKDERKKKKREGTFLFVVKKKLICGESMIMDCNKSTGVFFLQQCTTLFLW